jgi:hypothetical protein
VGIRAAALERVAAAARRSTREGPLTITPALAHTMGLAPDALGEVLQGLGYRRSGGPEGVRYSRRKPDERRRAAQARERQREHHEAERAAVSPFAKLRDLAFGG